MKEDTRKYEGQQCQDDDLNTAFRNLHKRLVEEIIGFCKAWNITIDLFKLGADTFEESIKCGSWQPCTDSFLIFLKLRDGYKKAFWNMDEEYLKTHTKEELDKLREKNEEPFMYSM